MGGEGVWVERVCRWRGCMSGEGVWVEGGRNGDRKVDLV